jgi:hypothetical protein
MGGASLADAPAQLGAGVAFSVKSRAFQVNAAGGGRVFGAAGFESRERNDTDKNAKEVRARLGWDLPISVPVQLSAAAAGCRRSGLSGIGERRELKNVTCPLG